jgi:hypothetical protein
MENCSAEHTVCPRTYRPILQVLHSNSRGTSKSEISQMTWKGEKYSVHLLRLGIKMYIYRCILHYLCKCLKVAFFCMTRVISRHNLLKHCSLTDVSCSAENLPDYFFLLCSLCVHTPQLSYSPTNDNIMCSYLVTVVANSVNFCS